jgi:hypothetical protein
MRIRIQPHVEVIIHKRAIREGRSTQQMVDRVIAAGLAAMGAASGSSGGHDEIDDRRTNDYKLTLTLPATTYRGIKSIARSEGRSGKEMIRRVLAEGLRVMGAELAAPADAGTEAAP